MNPFLLLSCCICPWLPCNKEHLAETKTVNIHIQDEKPVLLLGYYNLYGESTNGFLYEGHVTISTHGQNYLVEWTLNNGQTQKGTGVLVGRTLCLTYYSPECGYGAAGFYVHEDGSLEGAWSKHMDKDYGTEVLYFAAPL